MGTTDILTGTYIVAVSGGIDSVVLLHKLLQNKQTQIVVAHFDHGIRPDSDQDAAFVAGLANSYGLAFVTDRAELGKGASEELARKYRYEFLYKVQEEFNCDAIVTAHHQDDRIETAAINMLRGTKRRGFVSLRSTNTVHRPLLHVPKLELYEYAITHLLEWREDSTNYSSDYLRNRVRKRLAKSMTPENRLKIVGLLDEIEYQDTEIITVVNQILNDTKEKLPRRFFAEMPGEVAFEILSGWLRNNGVYFDAKALQRILEGLIKLNTGAKIDVTGLHYIQLEKSQIILSRR